MNIEFECNECGATLTVHANERVGDINVYVEPCEECLKAREEEGYEDGAASGYDDGYATGRDEGYDEGKDDGYTHGWNCAKEDV